MLMCVKGFWASCCGGLFAGRSNSDEAEDVERRRNPLIDAVDEEDDDATGVNAQAFPNAVT